MRDELTADDDLLHRPGTDDRWWTETYWFSFDQPGPDLSATIYPLFRPNLGVCSLGVFLWDGSAHEPWAVRYARNYWHLRLPETPATELELEGLSYRCRQPLQRYSVAYRDGDRLDLELEFSGLRPPHVASLGPSAGHFDQPCRVQGSVRLSGTTIEIDTFGMRDRTWSVRPENRSGAGTAYTYGNASDTEQFLVMTSLAGNEGRFISGVFSGYLVRDGTMAPLVDARRRVLERRHGYPVRIELEAVDALGRDLAAEGVTRNRLANQANPSQFAWMSMTGWTLAGGTEMIGEDQEVWSPDMLAGRLSQLDGGGRHG